MQPQASINGYCVLLITGKELLFNLILMSTSDFSIGTHEFYFPNISAFIAFVPTPVLLNLFLRCLVSSLQYALSSLTVH